RWLTADRCHQEASFVAGRQQAGDRIDDLDLGAGRAERRYHLRRAGKGDLTFGCRPPGKNRDPGHAGRYTTRNCGVSHTSTSEIFAAGALAASRSAAWTQMTFATRSAVGGRSLNSGRSFR